MIINVIESSEIYGYIAAFLTTVAFIPQLIKTWESQSAKDVSLTMLIIFIVGLLFWIVYGWLTMTRPVIIANIITLIINCSILLLKLSYRKP